MHGGLAIVLRIFASTSTICSHSQCHYQHGRGSNLIASMHCARLLLATHPATHVTTFNTTFLRIAAALLASHVYHVVVATAI